MALALSSTPRAVRIGALLFAVATFVISWWHWWTFQYGTFDLAFYEQALWLACRGRWFVSLLNVPLMGNHAEPIVFLLTPIFALWQHPMLFVIVQTLALATMPFTAWRITRQFKIERGAALMLCLATILTPATVLVGIYEFHPEALAAPLILLLIEAKLAARLGRFWLWFALVLSVKENMALLLAAWCAVFALVEYKRGRRWNLDWNIWPGVAALIWLLLCTMVISPALNAGNVDYLQLYSRLGNSGGDIVLHFFTAPQRVFGALWDALKSGNLIPGMLLPFLLLPLLRPRWWLIAAPLLFQHLLSLRYSEWSLGAHYPAPFIPLLWIATVEAMENLRRQRILAIAMMAACTGAQVWIGPVRHVVAEFATIADKWEERAWKASMVASVPTSASVVASQPFLSHLAKREHITSLHHILKGLKTLSRSNYEPPASADVVLIDYGDTSTFNTQAGYYHPRMRTDAEHVVASSDRLLHEFLRHGRWHVQAINEVSLFIRGDPLKPFDITSLPTDLDKTTTLLSMQVGGDEPGCMRCRFAWEFSDEREHFPWMMLVLSDGVHLHPFLKGACAMEAGVGRSYENWAIVFPASLHAGTYSLYALFFDGNEAAWQHKWPPDVSTYTLKTIDLGQRNIAPGMLKPIR